MQLAAVSYADGIDVGNIVGTVAGVFDRAVTIDSGEHFLTVASDSFGNMPGAILVAPPDGFRFADRIARGAESSVRGGVMRFADSDLAIDLRPATIWSSRIGMLRVDLERPPVRQAWEMATSTLRQDGRAESLLALAKPIVTALKAAAALRDIDAAAVHARCLIGLGDGVTPAGDDYLVGFLGGLWASFETPRDFVTALGAGIAAQISRTNRASGVYLAAAATGQVSERLTDLAAAIAVGEPQRAERAAAAALSVGHSSGACGVLGLLDGAASFTESVPAA